MELNLSPTQVGGQLATVRYSVYTQPGPYAGQTVDAVRAQLASLWAIPADAVPHKGKEALAGSYVIQPGDNIEFQRKQGEKGLVK